MIGQTVGHLRHSTSAWTRSTNAGQSSPHFDAQPFSPFLVTGGTTLSRSGLIDRYNLALGHLADKGDLADCLRLATQMKAQGVKPNILTYNCLIRACGEDFLAMQASAIFEDMLAVGLQPERETFHLLFKVCSPIRINPELFVNFWIRPLYNNDRKRCCRFGVKCWKQKSLPMPRATEFLSRTFRERGTSKWRSRSSRKWRNGISHHPPKLRRTSFFSLPNRGTLDLLLILL